MPKITLNEIEQKLAKLIAQGRLSTCKQQGIPNTKRGDHSDWKGELEGVASEIAACRFFNAYMDCKVDYPIGKKPEYDLITNTGHKCDVKATVLPYGRLMVEPKKAKKPCDFYVLAIGEFPTYDLIGWAYGDELFRKENLRRMGRKQYESYVIDQENLRKF